MGIKGHTVPLLSLTVVPFEEANMLFSYLSLVLACGKLIHH